jgi:serine/threonine-protein kinase RsbW
MLDEPGPNIRLELISDPFAVRDTLVELRAAWDQSTLDAELCDTAEQVLAEVLNNIVEHAHAESTDGRIVLSVKAGNDGFRFDVRDNGLPMPKGQLPAGSPADVDAPLDDLPEGGFGWFLIRALAEDLAYLCEGDWNVFRFRIAIAE